MIRCNTAMSAGSATHLVMDRLTLDMVLTLKEIREIEALHTKWLAEHEQRMTELDRKLDRIAGLILQGRGGNGHA